MSRTAYDERLARGAVRETTLTPIQESALKKARDVIAVGEIDPTQPVRFKSRRWVLSFLDRPTPV